MLTKFSHVALCVRDLDVTVRFYEKLGFKPFFDFTDNGSATGDVLGIAGQTSRMTFMRLCDDDKQSFLDIVQFVDPPTQGSAYPSLNNVGVCRLAFTVENIDETYAMLQDMGVEFVTPLQRLITPLGDPLAMVCFKDPDGIYLELIEGLKTE